MRGYLSNTTGKQALSVTCPLCRAKVNTSCMTPSGKSVQPHIVRYIEFDRHGRDPETTEGATTR